MLSEYVLKKKEIVQNIATGFLPRRVVIPLCQEKNVECVPVVQSGQRVEEGQVIAENIGNDSAKIHASIPGIVRGIQKCGYPDGKFGPALEIELSGRFSHIGRLGRSFDWSGYGAHSLLNRISALGLLNTFSLAESHSLAGDISLVEQRTEARKNARIFVRLFDEDLSCQTDSVLAACSFEKIKVSLQIISEILRPAEIIFASAKNDERVQANLDPLKGGADSEAEESGGLVGLGGFEKTFIQLNKKKIPCGTKHALSAAYKKSRKLSEKISEIIGTSLFVDAASLVLLADSIVYNVPVERVNVYVSGDCLRSASVLKVCVGMSFGDLARQLGFNERKIGKIIVNGYLNGFSVSSLDTPVTKYVKSVAFISKHDLSDYSSGICLSCGNCRSVCPSKICPDVLYGHLVNSIKVPQDFIRSSLLCSECGLCNAVCPTKLPLSQAAKILKEKQDV